MSEQKWAIRDEATGEWWGNSLAWTADAAYAIAYATYGRATGSTAWAMPYARLGARIVPAPPKKMTDEECWEWFKTLGLTWSIYWNSGTWGIRQLLGAETYIGATPCDAIRAARRALESK